MSNLTYGDYLDGTQQVLDQTKAEKKPYTVTICNREFTVLPNVFSPKYFFDTEIFAKNLPIKEGEELLEIGPGTGAISVTAALNGAKRVVAVDINPDAVKNAQLNAKNHGVEDRVEVRLGNLYEALKPNEKFDVIFWNTPFGLTEEENIPVLERAVYDPGYKATERFIKEAKQHLKEDGRVLIGFSSTLGRLDIIERFVKEAKMKLELSHEEESVETHPVKFEIFQVK